MLQAEKEKATEVGMWRVEITGEFETRENKQNRARKYERPKRTDLLFVNFKQRNLESKSKSEALVTAT